MPTPATHAVALARHPQSRGTAVRGIEVRVRRGPGDALALAYTIEGEISRLGVPVQDAPRFADRLWQHTCCECFIRVRGAPGYHEFNFSPSGAWAAYAFKRYRDGVPCTDDALRPVIATQSAPGSLMLDASIALGRLSAGHARAALALGVATVTEDTDGALAYWALSHAPGSPDFHHPDGFALEIA